jgi:hypothetical protein
MKSFFVKKNDKLQFKTIKKKKIIVKYNKHVNQIKLVVKKKKELLQVEED